MSIGRSIVAMQQAPGSGLNRWGFNFRGSAGFVVDESWQVDVLSGWTYPRVWLFPGDPTPPGIQAGFNVSKAVPGTFTDRETGVDYAPELSGDVFLASNLLEWQINLAPGTYRCRVGFGVFVASGMDLTIFDGIGNAASPIDRYSPDIVILAGGQYTDVLRNITTPADWKAAYEASYIEILVTDAGGIADDNGLGFEFTWVNPQNVFLCHISVEET